MFSSSSVSVLIDLEDAAGAGEAELHQVEGEDRDEGREAQRAEQAHEGHRLAQREPAGPPDQQRVQEGRRPGRRLKTAGRPVARLDLALAHVVVAVQRAFWVNLYHS